MQELINQLRMLAENNQRYPDGQVVTPDNDHFNPGKAMKLLAAALYPDLPTEAYKWYQEKVREVLDPAFTKGWRSVKHERVGDHIRQGAAADESMRLAFLEWLATFEKEVAA